MPDPWLNEHKSTAAMNYFLNWISNLEFQIMNLEFRMILLGFRIKDMVFALIRLWLKCKHEYTSFLIMIIVNTFLDRDNFCNWSCEYIIHAIVYLVYSFLIWKSIVSLKYKNSNGKKLFSYRCRYVFILLWMSIYGYTLKRPF
jgi:predicted ferric reductase